MPAANTVKIPCLHCKKKHVKCDEQRPICGRCQKNGFVCTRPEKPTTVFRNNGSASGFSKDQQWVNSEPTKFRFDKRIRKTSASPPQQPSGSSNTLGRDRKRRRSDEPPRSITHSSTPDQSPGLGPYSAERQSSWANAARVQPHPPPSAATATTSLPSSPRAASSVDAITLPSIWQNDLTHAWAASPAPPPAPNYMIPPLQTPQDPEARRFPLEDVQEACLMRYYVEQIGHWLDLCDEDRHFQLVVPLRARHQPHLLFAIFAVAARHLSRMPQYKTQHGIIRYQGQLLPSLDKHSAVEYTLKCIPALRRFHDTEDDEYRDSIIATAVILRQLEEIDDEEDGGSTESPENSSTVGSGGGAPVHSSSGSILGGLRNQINFLPIIDAVLRSPPSQTLFGRRSLIRAAYWMALRQEIYHSFTRRQPPQMILAADYWPMASSANKAVMHTVQVMKWRWGDGSEQEWNRLMRQQDHLEQDVLIDFQPIFHHQADKSKGEIFPTVWYTSNIEVTSIQQSIMARSVLTAENPTLKSGSGGGTGGGSALRSTWRRMESEVRGLMLELCGIALCHASSPPAILNAAFVIQMYGDFFTDQYERDALRGVVDKYREINAWPSQKLTEMFS